MNRPALSPELAAEEFAAWYWLKEELQAYCRAQRLPGSGSKAALMQRVQAHLAGQPLPIAAPVRATRSAMPAGLSLQTVVTPGWRLNPELRAFFMHHLGSGFRFNQTLRDFFRDPQGRTLADALALWRAAQQAPAQRISGQFQFNQHVRDFFAQQPGATREQMLAAWHAKRQTPEALAFSQPSAELEPQR